MFGLLEMADYYGALLGSKFSQVISSLSKVCVITISSLSQIDPSSGYQVITLRLMGNEMFSK